MFQYKTVIKTSMFLAVLILTGQTIAAESTKDAVFAAIDNPARPPADTKQDADRKPLDVLMFSGVKPGDKVADFIPGSGYMTRLFAKIVGTDGHVYAVVPEELKADADKSVQVIAADPLYANVTVVREPVNNFTTPEKLDMVWTSMNYHDLHDKFFGPADLSKVNKTIFDALKPGGVYLILDHTAEKGSGLRDTDTLHRIDPEAVKKEVLAAGFELADQSDVLHNPKDNHKIKVFDPSIRGKTDKFIFKFRKPMK